jgi:hypothetical protein
MSPADYERFRQQLEAQLRSDVELIYEAYLTKLRAYETVLRARGELEGMVWEPPAALSLPAAGLPALPGAAERTALPPAPAVAPPQAAPAAQPSPPPRKKAAPANDVYHDLLDLIEQGRAGETFTKLDLVRVLGYEPTRSTLHRALRYLESESVISAFEYGTGRAVTRFRRGPRPTAPAESAGETEPTN